MSASTMTVGEVREALGRFDDGDKLFVRIEPGVDGTCAITEIKKTDCRKVAIKVSDE